MNKNDQPSIEALLTLMTRLRDPETGCPWDVAQDFKSIAPYAIEEAYEVADAIEREDMDDLKDELGDLLLQVVFHAEMARELELFNFDDVARHVTEKMTHRHPHVFGDAEKAASPEDVKDRIWEQRKDMEKKRAAQDSVLDDVPLALPAIKRAEKLQKRAARVGFEWAEAVDVLDKLEEEIGEMREAIAGGREDEITDELGDLFFVLVNFGRMLGVDCEQSLHGTNQKFIRRFKFIESSLKKENKDISETSLDEMEALWQEQKRRERAAG